MVYELHSLTIIVGFLKIFEHTKKMRYGTMISCLFACHGLARSSCDQLFSQLALSTHWSHIKKAMDVKKCPMQYKILQWSAMNRGDEAVTFKEYVQFIDQSPDWPWLHKIKENAETKLDQVSVAQRLLFFKKNFPKTPAGSKKYIDALKTLPIQQALPFLKEVWLRAPMKEKQEKELFDFIQSTLSASQKISRIHRYLDQGQWRDAEKMHTWIKVSSVERAVIAARVALQKDKETPYHSTHGGFLLDLVKKHRKEYSSDAYQIIQSHKRVLYGYDPEKTWKEVHVLIRRLFEKNHYAEALHLLEGYQGLEPSSWIDAIWLEGWLKIKVRKNILEGVALFKKMYENAKTPISKAKAAYWVGEALSKQNPSQAKIWYSRAASYPTTFYGQEALLQLKRPFHIPTDPTPTTKDVQAFQGRSLIKAAKILQGTPLKNELKTFLFMALKTASSHGERLLILNFAKKYIPHEGVSLSKVAAQFQEVYSDVAYPFLEPALMTHLNGVDPALVHAVIRKESDFNSALISPAGALGLMQVMPGTGKMLAKEMKISFTEKALLKDRFLNVALGSSYLFKNLKGYGGSVILALASYNAGPKPTNQWIELFGDPQDSNTHRLNWIESIPYGETRNYIQRVIEAQRVYMVKLKGLHFMKVKA